MPPANTSTDPTGAASITVQRRIEWSDTDASGFYHNGAALRLFESGESVLLDRLGILDEIYGRLPRVRAEVDFLSPLRFNDLVQVDVEVTAVGRTSITYAFAVRHGEVVCVRGSVKAALIEPGGGPVTWPAGVRERLLSAGVQSPEALTASGPS